MKKCNAVLVVAVSLVVILSGNVLLSAFASTPTPEPARYPTIVGNGAQPENVIVIQQAIKGRIPEPIRFWIGPAQITVWMTGDAIADLYLGKWFVSMRFIVPYQHCNSFTLNTLIWQDKQLVYSNISHWPQSC